MNKDFVVLLQKLYNLRSDLINCSDLLEKNRTYILDNFPDVEFHEYMDVIVSLFNSFIYVADLLDYLSSD